MEAILETKAETILQFVRGLGGSLHVTFEEGTWAAWLHDLLKPHVRKVVVCDPRKNALLRVGNHNDREDARKLSELLYLNKIHPVYHGETEIRTPHPRDSVDCADADTQSLPYQAATMGLLRTGAQNVYQRGVPLRWWATETLQEDGGHSRTKQKS